MKLLLTNELTLSEGSINLELFFSDTFPTGKEKLEHEKSYVLKCSLTKGSKIQSECILKAIKDMLIEYFTGKIDNKRVLYVPSEYIIDIYSDCCIDVHYPAKYKNELLDNGYETEVDEISKNLMAILCLQDTDNDKESFEVEFKSLFLVDELARMSTLWEFYNGVVEKFLLKGISQICEN